VLSKPAGSVDSDRLPGLALLDVLFGSREPHFAAAAPKWKPYNTRLDNSQVCCCFARNTSTDYHCWLRRTMSWALTCVCSRLVSCSIKNLKASRQ